MKQTKGLLKHCTDVKESKSGCVYTTPLRLLINHMPGMHYIRSKKVTKIIPEFILSEIAVEFLDSCIEEKGIVTNATFTSEVQKS